MCDESVNDNTTTSHATKIIEASTECSYCYDIGHLHDACPNFIRSKEDAFYDIFGSKSDTEYESDDYNEIIYDKQSNETEDSVSYEEDDKITSYYN